MKKKPKAIHLTFKNNAIEDDLYDWIREHSDKCGFIKDIMLKEKKRIEKVNKKARFLRMED